MSYALIANVAAGSSDSNDVTTGAIDTTGATLLVAYVAEKESTTDATLTDSKGNTWTPRTEQKDVATANLLGRQFEAVNPASVGAGHTFTVTSSSGQPAVAVAAFSGAHLTTPVDQENGAVDIDAGLTTQPGSITPTEDDELVVTGLGFTANSATLSINGGFTITDQVDQNANHRGCGLAYLIQTSAAAANPTWTYSANEYAVATIVSYKKAAAGGGSSIAAIVADHRRRRV